MVTVILSQGIDHILSLCFAVKCVLFFVETHTVTVTIAIPSTAVINIR